MSSLNRLVLIALLVSAVNGLLWPVVAAFIKIDEMRLPYLVAVVALTTTWVAWLSSRIVGRPIRAALVGGVLGLLSSFLALQIAKLFDRAGPSAAFRGVGEFTIPEMWVLDVGMGILLGGWFAGMLASVVLSRMRA